MIFEAVGERFTELEREVRLYGSVQRRQRSFFYVALIAFSPTLQTREARAADSSAKELVLRCMTIVDEQGNRRILLDSKDTPMLALYDEKGTPCAFLGVLKGFAGLSLFDEKGTRAR